MKIHVKFLNKLQDVLNEGKKKNNTRDTSIYCKFGKFVYLENQKSMLREKKQQKMMQSSLIKQFFFSICKHTYVLFHC